MENSSFRRDITQKNIRNSKLMPIKGFSISPDMSLQDLVSAYKGLGFQASHVAQAVDIIGEMKKNNCAIFLSMTSNMISSGLRELITQIIKEKVVTAIITTTGAIEEDIMKTQASFSLGSFEADDTEVRDNALNRIGNIFVRDEQYCDFEQWHMSFIESATKESTIFTPSEYIRRMGLKINDKSSYLYWAAKNNIPVICPGFVDGAIGDHIYFFNKTKSKEEKLIIDIAGDVEIFYDLIIGPDKIAGVILGGSLPKHHLIGAAILRNGLDYAVYITTGTQYDGSLSGARPKEAVSWSKLKSEECSVCIEADATLVFPLIAYALLTH